MSLTILLVTSLVLIILATPIYSQEMQDWTFPEWTIDDDGCRTPDRGVGTCVSIKECEPMVTFLSQSGSPLPQRVIKLLQSYQCGFEGRSPKVCCPSGPIKIPGGTTTGIGGGIPNPPDISRHRNFNLLPKNCGYADTSDRIVFGNKTGVFEFPWMALISYQTSRGPDFRCGASILNENYILTAAHCITNLKSPLLGVRIGEHDIRTPIDCEERPKDGTFVKTCAEPFQDLLIEAVIPHPQYNSSWYANDIGLLRVSRMNLSIESARPVCLPLGKLATYNFTNKNVIVTGWGATETGRNSPDLLKVEIPTIAQETCRKTYENIVPISHKQLCAGGKNNRDSCAGDSGGPLQVAGFLNDDTRFIQQGIVSFGPRLCGSEGNPGVYTKVAYYMDWILDTIRP